MSPVLSMPIPIALPEPEDLDPADVLSSYDNASIDLICVLGPTASGKTRYAVGLARVINALCGKARCEILSADSRQVYRGMDIGTGKDLCEYGDIPCHLIDIAPAGSKYNVYQYQKAFCRAYSDILSRGGIPILCGGTGLYIEAAALNYRFGQNGNGTSDVPSEMMPSKTFFIGTLVSREERIRRIDRRLDERLGEGLVEEVRGLLDSGIAAEDLIYYGLEYKYVTQYVIGEISFDYMREHLATAIHQFAKRQMTWFRGMEKDGAVIHWVQV